MSRPLVLAAALIAVVLAAVAAVIKSTGPAGASASSHREAPLISEDPSADLTDVYAFRSPDKPDTVTIIANVLPGEDPAAGPNWYTFSPTARYNLKIDTNGDVNRTSSTASSSSRRRGRSSLATPRSRSR